MDMITIKIMKQAIEHKIGLRTARAKKIATFIMDMFGYELRIIDNVLTSDERQIFYMLEQEGILSTCREQTRLYDGRAWMTHYWELNTTDILRYSIKSKPQSIKKTLQEKVSAQTNIYNTLSEEKWLTRKILNHDPFSTIH
ncbi:MAG: hypothetical protein KGY67_04585 [Candidatus Thermoplasmatota archaeon]|nr:hypothetical protein [Candidatus Thermoplasmatota archaeon]